MKAKKLLVVYTLLLFVVIAVMTSLWQLNKGKASRDYPEIKEEGILRIVTEYNQSGYYISGDTIEGFQYELSQAIADIAGVEVHISLETSLTESLDLLSKGKYDIIARNVPVTLGRKDKYLFSDPIVFSKQVLVQRTNDTIVPIRNQLKLAGKYLYVQKDSPAMLRLRNLESEIGDSIHVIEEEFYSDEQLIFMVAKGEIGYAVCDYQMAYAYRKIYPEIDIDTNISFTQLQSWVVREKAFELLDSLNVWLIKIKENGVYDKIYKRYYNRI